MRSSILFLGLFLSAFAGCKTTESKIAKPDPAKIQMAKETLNEVTDINDQVAEQFYQQGLSLEESGQVDQAIDQYLHAIKVKPSFAAIVYLQLGILYQETTQYTLAQEALENATELNPRSALAYYNLALATMLAKQPSYQENAAQAMRKALDINPDIAKQDSRGGETLEKLNTERQTLPAGKLSLSR